MAASVLEITFQSSDQAIFTEDDRWHLRSFSDRSRNHWKRIIDVSYCVMHSILRLNANSSNSRLENFPRMRVRACLPFEPFKFSIFTRAISTMESKNRKQREISKDSTRKRALNLGFTKKDVPVLLDDDQMAMFVRQGFIILTPECSKAFHDQIYAICESYDWKRGGQNPGNNVWMIDTESKLLALVPEVKQIWGKITRLFINRTSHSTRCFDEYSRKRLRDASTQTSPSQSTSTFWMSHSKGFAAQQNHKDSFWGYTLNRHNAPNYLLAMYYPQDVTKAMGPTGVHPGSQYHCLANPDDKKRKDLPKRKYPKYQHCRVGIRRTSSDM